MKPTDEQLEAVAAALLQRHVPVAIADWEARAGLSAADIEAARAAWDIIAPMVLERAADMLDAERAACLGVLTAARQQGYPHVTIQMLDAAVSKCAAMATAIRALKEGE